MSTKNDRTNAASMLASHGNKKRWEGFSPERRSEIMRQIRKSKANRPRGSDAFHTMNGIFLAENSLAKKKRSLGDYSSGD